MPTEHHQMLCEITETLVRAGRKDNTPTVASIGIAEEVAENASEAELISETGQRYLLSVIRDDG